MQNCYNRSSGEDSQIPLSLIVDQEKQLTRKQIDTLGFIQEIGRENKILNARINELEAVLSKCSRLHEEAQSAEERIEAAREEGLQRAAEMNKKLMQQHALEMEARIRCHADDEKSWCSLKQSLQAELFKLQMMVGEYKEKNGTLEASVEELQDEVLRLRQHENVEASALREEKTNLLIEIGRLETQNMELTSVQQELQASEQKVHELSLRVQTLERDLGAAQANDDKDRLLRAKAKSRQLKQQQRQLTELVRRCQQEREESAAELAQARDSLLAAQEAQRLAEEEAERLRGVAASLVPLAPHPAPPQPQQPLAPPPRARRGSSDAVNFRDFVGAKRELGKLREENSALREALTVGQRLPPIGANLGGPPGSVGRSSAGSNGRKVSR